MNADDQLPRRRLLQTSLATLGGIALGSTPVQADEIQISITDNGVGFDLATTQKGNGLNNMQKRIERIGGILTLDSVPGQGTQIKVLLHKNQFGLI